MELGPARTFGTNRAIRKGMGRKRKHQASSRTVIERNTRQVERGDTGEDELHGRRGFVAWVLLLNSWSQ